MAPGHCYYVYSIKSNLTRFAALQVNSIEIAMGAVCYVTFSRLRNFHQLPNRIQSYNVLQDSAQGPSSNMNLLPALTF